MKTKRQHKENKDVISDNKLSQSRKGERIMNSSKTLKAAVITIAIMLTIGFTVHNSYAYKYGVNNQTQYTFKGILKVMDWEGPAFIPILSIPVPDKDKNFSVASGENNPTVMLKEDNLNCMTYIKGYFEVEGGKKIEIESKHYPAGFCANHSYVLKQTEYNDPYIGKWIIFSLCETDGSNCWTASWR